MIDKKLKNEGDEEKRGVKTDRVCEKLMLNARTELSVALADALFLSASLV